MKTLTTIIFLILILLPLGNSVRAQIPDNMDPIGTGKAYYLKFIKVYDATLYAENSGINSDILDPDTSKCLRLEYAVSVSKADFVTAADTVLKRQFSAQTLDMVADKITTLHDGYQDVAKGDQYTLCYDRNNHTTTLALNNDKLLEIKSAQFAQVYFSIWLGADDPLDKKLRNDLLAVN